MSKRRDPTGISGVGLNYLPKSPIGAAELLAQEDSSEYGLGEGLELDYTGKTPECPPNIGIGYSM
jgi:hypothetical protein